MSWDFLFGFVNVVALAGWLLLALLPRGPKLMAVVMYACVAMLCLAYAILLAALLSGLVGTGSALPTEPGGVAALAAVQALFASKGGVVVGWIHYLAFDLFVGLWIARDADNKGFARWVQLPFLAATMLAGPIGLLAWLMVRERRARRLARGA